MKISVTYQKEDIINLIKQDLLSKDLVQAEGTEIKYTGMKPVTIIVESIETPVKELRTIARNVEVPIEEESLEDVLAKAKQIEESSPPQRRLRPNESLDFPSDKVVK
jgi:hypothetical protein